MDRKTFKKLAINNNWKSLMGNSINCTFNGRKPRNKNGKCFEIEIKNNKFITMKKEGEYNGIHSKRTII